MWVCRASFGPERCWGRAGVGGVRPTLPLVPPPAGLPLGPERSAVQAERGPQELWVHLIFCMSDGASEATGPGV